MLCESFNLIFINEFEEYAVEERHSRTGSSRAGSSRVTILHRKRIIFCSMSHIAKINISRVMILFCFPIWLWQEALCVDQRDYSRRVSLLRSLIRKRKVAKHKSGQCSETFFLVTKISKKSTKGKSFDVIKFHEYHSFCV